MHASTPAAAAAFRLLSVGSSDEIASAARRAGARSAAASILASACAWCRGDVRAAESSLRTALAEATPEERVYAAGALAALLCACGRYARAASLLASVEPTEPVMWAVRAALRAIVHAATGAGALAVRDADAARAALRALRDDAFGAHVRAMLAHAAYLRADATAALGELEPGLRAARVANAPRPAAALHAAAYATHRGLRGDADAAWRHALQLERDAARGGDGPLLTFGRTALCELAAERGDDARAAAYCDGVVRCAAYDADFGLAIATALRRTWARDWAAPRAALSSLASAATRSCGERALCRALLALNAVARGDDAHARRLSRRAVSSSSRPPHRVRADEMRRLRLARALAAVAGELAGDVVRARRAADARFLRDDAVAAALWLRRGAASADAMPASVRGYARAIVIARERALQRPARGVLTPAEATILREIAAGRTVAAIAERTGRSPHTVRTHLRNAAAKLGAHGRADVLAKARTAGAI